MANKEMKTIKFPNSDTVYEIVDNAAREALAGKQPSGDYATKTELTEGLAGKQPAGDYATVEQLNQGLDGKQPTGDYATRTELSQGLAEKQPAGDYVTRQKLDEDLAKKQPVGDYVTNDELTSGLAEKQPVGDYATNTALTEGLASKQPMGDYATNTALAEGLAQKQPTGNYALKSELPDVSAFITKSVNDLVNYYTKTEVDNKISTIPKFSIKVVDILPFDSISTTTIYLLKTPAGTNGDLYTEYIYVDGAWESLGTQTVDLSGYVTTEALNSAIADFVTAEYVSTALAKYVTSETFTAHTGNTNNPHSVTKSQVGLENVANERQYSSQNPPPYPVQSVAGKTGIVTLNKSDVQLGNVDNTADMAKPVSTAQSAAINAKYTKPASGIPKTDLSEEVQNALDSILNTAFVDVVLNGSALEFKNAKGVVVKTVELPEPDEPTVDGNLLTEPVSFTSVSMTDPNLPILDYSLGLKIDNTYTIDITIDGENHVIDDQPGIPSNYPQSIGFYGGVTLGNMGGEAILVTLTNGKQYMLMVVDKADYSMMSGAVYNPNKCSIMCMEFGQTGEMSAVPVTLNSIVLKTSVPENRLRAPVTIPAQSTSNITGLTVQGELNLGTEATIDSSKPGVMYELQGTIGGQAFTSFLVGGYAAGQYYPFGIYGTIGGGATACDDGIPSDNERPFTRCGITGIAMNAAWSGTDFVAAEGSWAIRVEALVDEISGTPEIIINSIKRVNFPNMLTEDISLSSHQEEETGSPNYVYYGEATKPAGVSLEAGARYIVGVQIPSNDVFYATAVAATNSEYLNCVMIDGYPAYSADSANRPWGRLLVVDGLLYDNTQDPTKWTFTAGVDSPVTAFYLAKVE